MKFFKKYLSGSFSKNKNPLYAILFLAFFLRLITINQSLWLDEAIGAIAARDYSYRAIISNFLVSDNHPPLYYLLLRFWTQITGYSELSIRLPSVFFGVGTVLLIFKIVTETKLKKEYAFLAALILSTSQVHVFYSQEARMYSMACFFVTLAVYSLIKLLSKFSLTQAIFFSIALAGMMFSDYMPIYIIPAFLVSPFIYKKDLSWWRKYILLYIPLFILFVFWFEQFSIQSGKGKWLLDTLPAWKTVAGGASLKQAALIWSKFTLGRISFFNKTIQYLLTLITSVPFLVSIFYLYKKINKLTSMLIFLFIAPLILGFISSIFFPAFIFFRYLYLVPLFYILVVIGISSIKNKKIKALVISGLVITNIVSLCIYYLDKNQQRENWRDAVKYVESQAQNGEVVLFSFPEPFAPYRWYMTNSSLAYGATDSISANEKATNQIVSQRIQGKNAVYYFNYLSDLSDPKGFVVEALQKQDFEVSKSKSFQGVGELFYLIKK